MGSAEAVTPLDSAIQPNLLLLEIIKPQPKQPHRFLVAPKHRALLKLKVRSLLHQLKPRLVDSEHLQVVSEVLATVLSADHNLDRSQPLVDSLSPDLLLGDFLELRSHLLEVSLGIQNPALEHHFLEAREHRREPRNRHLQSQLILKFPLKKLDFRELFTRSTNSASSRSTNRSAPSDAETSKQFSKNTVGMSTLHT